MSGDGLTVHLSGCKSRRRRVRREKELSPAIIGGGAAMDFPGTRVRLPIYEPSTRIVMKGVQSQLPYDSPSLAWLACLCPRPMTLLRNPLLLLL